MSLGILKYSTVEARAKEFGGIIHTSSVLVIKLLSEKFFGSTIDEFTLVNILNSLETLASYPNEERPYDILLDLSCFSINGLIIPCSKDIFLIHLSERTLIIYFLIFF